MLIHDMEDDGSRGWDSIKSVLERKFASEGARDFSDEAWLQKIFEGSTKKRIEFCKDKDGFLCYLRAIQGDSGCIPIESELMGYVFIPRNLKRNIFQRGLSWNYQSVLAHGLIPGGKEKDKDRQAVFLTPTNPFGNDLEEDETHDDLSQFHRRYLS